MRDNSRIKKRRQERKGEREREKGCFFSLFFIRENNREGNGHVVIRKRGTFNEKI